MLIAWNNLWDTGSVSAGSTLTGYDANRTQHPQLSKQWRTAAGTKNSYLICDLASAQSCAVMAVLGTNLTSSATFRIRSSDTDATVTTSLEVDTGTVSSAVVTGYGAIYKTFAATSSRYWRIDIEDTTVASNLQIGRVFLGPSWTPTYGHSYGWSVGWLDESRRLETYGGQTYIDRRNQARVLNFSLDWNSEAQMFGNAFALAKAQGLASDVLVIPDTAGSYLSQQAVWGLLAESTPIRNELVGVWRQRFTVKERL